MPRRRSRTRARVFLTVGTALYLAFVAWVTLGPQPLDDDGTSWLRTLTGSFAGNSATAWITYDVVEFTANIAMFVPLGWLFLSLLGARRWWLALLFGIIFTCFIEFFQQFLPTRVPDLRDIIANSLGATIGVGIGLAIIGVRSSRR
ncbi:VanZ family protein [Leifsonia sp. A12D58]|uniref:VanZ family protein n=1 Tax=Leifsonia sp. A12D58 TaxID=3397674 RepID=UPI0039DF2C12